MLQPKTAKKYIEPVEQISDEFIQRVRAIRDGNDETPADFSNEMNKWALESIACIGLETRLGLLGEIEKDSDGQRMIQVNLIRNEVGEGGLIFIPFNFRASTISLTIPTSWRLCRPFGGTTRHQRLRN